MDDQGTNREGGSMKKVIAVILLLVAAFCVYGFIAAGEPEPNHIYFRIGYPIVGIASLAAAVAMLVRKKKFSHYLIDSAPMPDDYRRSSRLRWPRHSRSPISRKSLTIR